jgi:hypothetical protein
MRSPSPKPKTLEDRGLDDSDDELPDVSNMFDERPRKRYKKTAVDDVSLFFSASVDLNQCMPLQDALLDLTMDDITGALPRENNVATSDSDIESVGTTRSPGKGKAKAQPSSLSTQYSGKRPRNQGNKNSRHDGPSDVVIATWKRGDDDLEPSAKMLAMVQLLKEWDSCGDKTICYSQCTCCHPHHSGVNYADGR